MSPEPREPSAASSSQGGVIEALEARLGQRWEAIRAARAKTDELRARLREALSGIDDANCAVVVTGSLGRGEACEDSDADWILLVDGPSDPEHARLARLVGERIRGVMPKEVGRTGTFGNIVVSHELVHYVAGTRDTNENLTRRILLLAESYALTNAVVRERVIRNVLSRYVFHDRSVESKSGRYDRIPHFLLNDVVRYWRTMTSDYASKMWERNREGWGTRNIKLRFSRKLLFAWGLLASFSGELFEDELRQEGKTEAEFLTLLSDLIRRQTEVSPLELLATVAAQPGVGDDTVGALFSAYDTFLGALSDPAKRRHLDAVRFEDARDDAVYDHLRVASGLFRRGLGALFFDEHERLKRLIRNFGVF